MKKHCFAVIFVAALLCLLAGLVYAAGKNGSPLYATVVPYTQPGQVGTYSDGHGAYTDGVDGVVSALQVNYSHAAMQTYNSPRVMHFVFDTSDAGWAAAANATGSTLDKDGVFDARVNFDCINWYGNYKAMGPGTITQGAVHFQFYAGNLTYEMDYDSVGIIRGPFTSTDHPELNVPDVNSWLITTSLNASVGPTPPYTGFDASDLATLMVVRRKSVTTYGDVNVPFSIIFTLK